MTPIHTPKMHSLSRLLFFGKGKGGPVHPRTGLSAYGRNACAMKYRCILCSLSLVLSLPVQSKCTWAHASYEQVYLVCSYCRFAARAIEITHAAWKYAFHSMNVSTSQVVSEYCQVTSYQVTSTLNRKSVVDLYSALSQLAHQILHV